MFSSIASFLPAALHIGPNDAQRQPRFKQDDPASEDEQDDFQASRAKQPQDQPQTAPRNREKSANENFIIVRPPPSKSNHPLNLQVQLVPPNVKPPNGVVSQSSASIQSATTDTNHTLARTSSLRSEASYTNYGSSTSSFASVASSSASTRRTIVPLYNLQAHNVMTNVIVDAGTDAKIAKFQRRGIILIDLASLEPVEVWGDSPSTAAGRTSINLNADDQQINVTRHSALSTRSAAPSSRAHTPDLPTTSSAISINSVKQIPHHSSNKNASQPQPQPSYPTTSPSVDVDSDATPTLTTPRPQTPSQPKRNIFGKLFQNNSNKKLANSTNVHPSSSPIAPSFTISHPSQDSSLSTLRPTLPHQVGSVPADGSKSERNHARNISLTTFTAPIKAPFRSNKNRFTSAIPGSSSSSSLNVNAPLDGQNVGLGIASASAGEKTASSPNMSATSLAVTNESMDSGSVTFNLASTGNPLLQVPPHLVPLSHSYQTSSGSTSNTTPQTQLQQLQSRPPVLGIQPTYVSSFGSNLSGPSDVKRMRALMYVWLVRKWLKRPPNCDEHSLPFSNVAVRGGIFLGLGSRAKDEEHHVHPVEPGAGVEVRFEWKRGKARSSGRGRTGKEKSETDGRRPRKRQSIATTTGDWDDGDDCEDMRTQREKSRDSRKSVDKRLSSLSVKSNQSARSGPGEADPQETEEGSQKKSSRRPKNAAAPGTEGNGFDGDEGEESEPEDSETPWVCTMKIRRTTPSSSLTGNGSVKQHAKPGGEKDVLKLKVGTLSPTPHHPKVVAMLKIPFPLPDVEVERLNIRRRVLRSIHGQGGVNELGEVSLSTPRDARSSFSGGDIERPGDEYKGLELAAEEIKDIVCSTALWLIVREGTGGVGRISRKGDGWKLRS